MSRPAATPARTWEEMDAYVRPRWDRSGLVIIDVQEDFLDEGRSPIPGTTSILPHVGRLLEVFRGHGRPIVHVVRLYDGPDVDLVRRELVGAGDGPVRPATPGSQIAAPLRPYGAGELDPQLLLRGEAQPLASDEWALWKPRWSGFYRTRLDDHLQSLGVDTVVVAGCNFPNCPRATIVDASNRDYRVVLVTDAVSQLRDEHLPELAGIGVAVGSVGDIEEQLGAAVT